MALRSATVSRAMFPCVLVMLLLTSASRPAAGARDVVWAAEAQAACPCSLWPASAVPDNPDAGPDRPVEVGVKFRAAVDGQVTAIRFFKSIPNTGAHVGNVWSADGSQLASVAFTNETSFGWQTAVLTTPVRVRARTIYVVSYHAPSGHYAFSRGYFEQPPQWAGPLHALAASEQPNGVFRYGEASVFPTETFDAANYWVDVVFEPAANHMTVAEAPAIAPHETVRIVSTTAADYSTGKLETVAIVQSGDGEIVLEHAAGTDFSDDTAPRGWISTLWSEGGSARFGDGRVQLNGARVESAAILSGGRSLEFSATFSGGAHEHAGFGVTLAAPPWAIFSTFGGKSLWARTDSGDGLRTDTVIDGDWIDQPHRFRIDWRSNVVTFFADGKEVASHPTELLARMRPVASDLSAGDGGLEVDWMRLSPYAREGTFTSKVFDADEPIAWTNVSWSAEIPEGTSLAVSVRGGATPVPDKSWTPFTRIAASGGLMNQTCRYVQYRVDLATTSRSQTPSVESVTISGGQPTAAPLAR